MDTASSDRLLRRDMGRVELGLGVEATPCSWSIIDERPRIARVVVVDVDELLAVAGAAAAAFVFCLSSANARRVIVCVSWVSVVSDVN